MKILGTTRFAAAVVLGQAAASIAQQVPTGGLAAGSAGSAQAGVSGNETGSATLARPRPVLGPATHTAQLGPALATGYCPVIPGSQGVGASASDATEFRPAPIQPTIGPALSPAGADVFVPIHSAGVLVRDRSGGGLPGAAVAIIPIGEIDVLWNTQTNGQGEAFIPLPGAGKYLLIARWDGRSASTEFAVGSFQHVNVVVTLGVSCYANCDGSAAAPIVNVNDLTCFVARFQAGDAYANCDGSTQAPVLNVGDFICFMNKLALGCGPALSTSASTHAK